MKTEEASPAKQLASFIAKFDPTVGRMIRNVRTELTKRMPGANQLVYDNYNFLAIGFCSSERVSDAIVSIAAARNGVQICFLHGASLPDPRRVLIGNGNQTRFLRIDQLSVLRSPAVGELFDLAIARAKTPLAAAPKGKLIIKSISAKQRPRR